MAYRIFLNLLLVAVLDSCISTQIRLPSSARQVNRNENIQQLLLLAAQNNILFYVPETATREVEKTEINQKCRDIDEPLWAEKLSSYLSEFRKRPEFLNRFHIIEIKRGDRAQVQVQKDLDDAITLSIQFVKIESRGKVGIQTKLPCSSSIAEFLNREIIKTDYEFPTLEAFNTILKELPERKAVPRFQFSNVFLTYLAERGVIFKFNHEMSFEKTTKGQYVMVEILNKLGDETRQPFHQYLNYWFRQISEQSIQAQLIQMFAVLPDRDPKSGIHVESQGDHARRVLGESDLTYLFATYSVENEVIKHVGLKQLDECLQSFTTDMSGVRMRKPAATDRESFLRPGYVCSLNQPGNVKAVEAPKSE